MFLLLILFDWISFFFIVDALYSPVFKHVLSAFTVVFSYDQY